MPNFTHFDRLADQEGFLVAYPESFNKSWSDSRGLSPADDVGFIRSVIEDLQRTHRADPSALTPREFRMEASLRTAWPVT